jgi:hypothetical protein
VREKASSITVQVAVLAVCVGWVWGWGESQFNSNHLSRATCSNDYTIKTFFSQENRIFPFLVEDLNVDSGVAILRDWEEELLIPLWADRVLANLTVQYHVQFIKSGSVSSVSFWASRIRILPSTSKKI